MKRNPTNPEIATASQVASPAIRIVDLRGDRVVLDQDVAKLFDIETRKLNQQVSRNKERFGDDFAFRLTKDEVENLKSQNVISSAE